MTRVLVLAMVVVLVGAGCSGDEKKEKDGGIHADRVADAGGDR